MKKVLAFLLTLALALSLAACGSSGGQSQAGAQTNGGQQGESQGGDAGSAEDTLTVAFCQYANLNNWRVTQTNDMEATMKGAGYRYIYTDAGDDTAQQVSDLEDIIAQNPDYIVLAPREEKGYESVLAKAAEQGITVITVDRDCEGEKATYIAANFIWESENCANYMIEQLGTTDPINIVELTGTPGSTCAIERQKGFMDVVGQHDNYTVIASQVGDFSRTTSQTAMENLIQSYGDEIDVVYAHNDDNAIGALQAIKAAGLKPGEDILIYSVDGQRDALQAIVNGEMELSVLCSPYFGETVLEVINTLENGGSVEEYIQNPGKLYTAENAEACLDEAY